MSSLRRSIRHRAALVLSTAVVLSATTACGADDRATAGQDQRSRTSTTRGDEPRPIVVEAPSRGQRVSSPMTVSGTANVFEATVSMRLLDAEGEVIAEKFTTATCGSGCRGDYSTPLRFDVDSEQEATLEVFESSAEDGRALHTVAVPVLLVP